MESNWSGRFIAADDTTCTAPLLRHEFTLHHGHGAVRSAQLIATAHGLVEPHLNGFRVSKDLLTPGWSSYEWRTRYAEYDVTESFADVARAEGGVHVLGLMLGNGWYRGRLAWTGEAGFYGDKIAGFAELRILFDDGHEQIVATGTGTWLAAAGGTVANDLYDGQSIDARAIPHGWSQAGHDVSRWQSTHIVDAQLDQLEPYIGPPVRAVMERRAERVWRSPSGRLLLDFGQNLVGWVRATVRGRAGQQLVLRHAEVLEGDELGTRPLRSAKATDTFILSGGEDVFEPTLTFHGFRYVEVEGWEGNDDDVTDALVAVVISSDMQRIGHFSCSDERLNRLHENVVWSMRGNFVDVPTDCPQRDERLGWTGDLAVFAPTATYLYDTRDFLRDWYRDLIAEQSAAGGRTPLVVPDVLKYIHQPELPPVDTAALWSDATVVVPWEIWQAYGDATILREARDAMIAHADRVWSRLSPAHLWDSGFQFGDWLDPDAPADQPWAAKADPSVVATACAFRTFDLLSRMLSHLGDIEGEARQRTRAGTVRAAFRRSYLEGDRIVSDAPTVYALAVVFGLLDETEQAAAGARLAKLIRDAGHRITTGFAGTPFAIHALSATGHLNDAYSMLTRSDSPSWLYPVTMGATTIWERWDSMLPDGTINPGDMTSFNHYAFGSVADWMHQVIGGLRRTAPGWRSFVIAPRPGGGITSAETSVMTPLGLAAVRWEVRASVLRVEATVPSGATASIDIPGHGIEPVAEGSSVLEFSTTASQAGVA
ncbi:family 78 glycoside hydrolase catalytic domain [Microbacterium sp. NPDC088619]|uniref:alpha-L-rhamnosidase n=1 Tax=Microbacterium sp. NPDC088619 TaxID=3364196 RepID=UPI00382EB3BA